MNKIKEYLEKRFRKGKLELTYKERLEKCLELVRRNIVIASETRDRTNNEKDKTDISECIYLMKKEKVNLKRLIAREDNKNGRE